MIDSHHLWNKRFQPLFWGLILGVVLTVAAYLCVSKNLFSGWTLTLVLFGLCILQTITLLIFYFHLLLESKPRWNLMLFLFVALVVIVVIGGTLWIMYNLDYNTMPRMEA